MPIFQFSHLHILKTACISQDSNNTINSNRLIGFISVFQFEKKVEYYSPLYIIRLELILCNLNWPQIYSDLFCFILPHTEIIGIMIHT